MLTYADVWKFLQDLRMNSPTTGNKVGSPMTLSDRRLLFFEGKIKQMLTLNVGIGACSLHERLSENIRMKTFHVNVEHPIGQDTFYHVT